MQNRIIVVRQTTKNTFLLDALVAIATFQIALQSRGCCFFS